jgi:hypothetical protein
MADEQVSESKRYLSSLKPESLSRSALRAHVPVSLQTAPSEPIRARVETHPLAGLLKGPVGQSDDLSNLKLDETPHSSKQSVNPEFCVRLYVCDDLLILMDSSDDASLSKERRLLENVLVAAFSKSVIAEYLAQCVWPLFDFQNSDQKDEAPLRENILRRFFDLASAHKHKKFFYFGSVFDRNALVAIQAGESRSESSLSMFPVSIFDCMNDASSKRLLWAALRPDHKV